MQANSVAMQFAALLLVLGGAALAVGAVFPALRRIAMRLLAVGAVIATAAGLIR